jgi:carbonic anhydrase
MTYPEVAERAADGRPAILGWHYTIDTGVIEQYDREQLAFHPVKALDLSRVLALDATGL